MQFPFEIDYILCVVQSQNLKPVLDQFYLVSISLARLRAIPIEFPRSYLQPEDKEISGFIASCIRLRQRQSFQARIRTLLSEDGRESIRVIRQFNIKAAQTFAGIKYRFNENDDIIALF